MLIKAADDKQPQIDALQALLARPDVDAETRTQIDREIKTTRAGAKEEHRVRRVSGTEDGVGRFVPVTVAGPLCSGLDILATEAMLTVPEPGDLMAVLDVGAYGFTEAMPFFLSHPIPAEVAVRGGLSALLRPPPRA